MKICIGILGLPRSIDLIIYNMNNLLKNNLDISYYLCISKNFENYEKEYCNIINFNKLLDNKNINKILLINDNYDDSYRNSLNYIYKLDNLLNIIPNNYDFYIILRSDLILNNIDFINKVKNLSFCSFINNPFIKNQENKINMDIIISNNYHNLLLLKDLFTFAKNNNNYVELILYNYLLNLNFDLINIDYKLILSKCNIIAIAGDSGSGKTTLSLLLKNIFDKNVLMFETDRYHKWERGNKNYEIYTHLNPYANHLEKMNNDIYQLKIGNDVFAVDYDHTSGKFTSPNQIKSSDQIILCGLHTLYTNDLNELLDIKIFMDTDRNLIKKWKIQRDINQRGYSIDKILEQIDKRNPDYIKYISQQKENADIIINFYELNEELKCKLILQNNKFKLDFFINNNYIINFQDNKIIIELKNKFYELNIQNYFNNYYLEILYFIILYLKN